MADNVAMLQHQLTRFGIITVMDATLYEYGTVKPVLKLDTLKVSSISMDGSTKEIRGGMAADLLLAYNHSRTCNVEVTDALLSLHSLAALWGSSVSSVTVQRFQEEQSATTVDVLPTFTHTALVKKDGTSGSAVYGTDYIYLNETSGNYLASATPTSGEIAVGDVIGLYGYEAVSAGSGYSAVETVLKSTTFPNTLTLVGRTVFLDESTGKQVLAEIEIPKFQFGNAFNFSMDGEGDASTFDFSGVALAEGTSKELIKIKTLKIGNSLMENAWD